MIMPQFISRISPRARLLINVLVITGLILLVVAMFLPSNEAPTRPNLPVLSSSTNNVEVRYTGSTEFLKKELPLYQLQGITPIDTLFTTWVNALELSPNPLASSLFQSADNQISLAKAPEALEIEYDNQAAAPSEVVSKSDAEATATLFLKKLGYNTDELALDDSFTRFTTNELAFEGLDDSSESEATVITLAYQRRLEGLPVGFSTSHISHIELWVTKGGVYKALLPTLSFTAQKGSMKKLLTLDEIIAQMQTGYFYPIGSLSSVEEDPTQGEIISVSLAQAWLEYRIDEGQGLIMPFARFAGSATLRNGEVVEVGLITPAISTTQ